MHVTYIRHIYDSGASGVYCRCSKSLVIFALPLVAAACSLSAKNGLFYIVTSLIKKPVFKKRQVMPLGQAGPTPPTAAATRAPPMHATRDTRHGTHHTRTTTKNSRTKAPRSTNTSVSGRMLLSSEFQLTKNSHQSQSEAYTAWVYTGTEISARRAALLQLKMRRNF